MSTITNEDVVRALKMVTDPEMHIDIFTLGLIYHITCTDEGVDVLMTLTTPLCPYADEIVSATKDAIRNIGALTVNIEITFEPAWNPPEDLRIALGL